MTKILIFVVAVALAVVGFAPSVHGCSTLPNQAFATGVINGVDIWDYVDWCSCTNPNLNTLTTPISSLSTAVSSVDCWDVFASPHHLYTAFQALQTLMGALSTQIQTCGSQASDVVTTIATANSNLSGLMSALQSNWNVNDNMATIGASLCMFYSDKNNGMPGTAGSAIGGAIFSLANPI
eukprot:ANDGO_04618.mRNA.1 hypothetical protein